MRFSRRRALAAAVFAPLAAKLPNPKHAAATAPIDTDSYEVRYRAWAGLACMAPSFRVSAINVDTCTITLTYDDDD